MTCSPKENTSVIHQLTQPLSDKRSFWCMVFITSVELIHFMHMSLKQAFILYFTPVRQQIITDTSPTECFLSLNLS